MKRRRLILFFMGLTLLITLAFQVMWVVVNWHREEFFLRKQASMLLRESMQDFFFKALAKDGIESNLSIHENHDGLTSTIEISESKFSHIDSDSVKVAAIALPRAAFGSEGPIALQSHKVFISDSTLHSDDPRFAPPPIDTVNKQFAFRMKEEGLSLPFVIILTGNPDSLFETSGGLFTLPAPIGFSGKKWVVAEISGYSSHIFRRILPHLLISILVVAITAFTLFLLWRNLRSQHRMALQQQQLVANITHELKTPIATVSIALEALQEFHRKGNLEKTGEYLSISRQEMTRLALLTDNVLRLSMMEQGAVQLKPEMLDLLSLARTACDAMRIQAHQAGGALELNAASGDFQMEGDQLHLMSVILNLIDNGIKYAAPNPVVKVSLKAMRDAIEMEVQDNGIGIAKADQGRVFEKFYRVSHGDVHDVKGFGLGLNYVHEIVKRHGGSVALKSAPGEGSNFTLTFQRRFHGQG